MSKTNLYLVRHAETVGNVEKRLTGRQEYVLTKKGKETIQAVELELDMVKFDVAYSSPARRTIQTMQNLASLNDLPILTIKGLSEMYFGIYDGWKWEEVNQINPKIKQIQEETNQIMGIEKQETMEEVANRMYTCISNICKQHEGETILICSHGVAIEAFLRKVTQVPFYQQREKYCQHNVAINQLEYKEGKFTILRMADAKYLQKFKKRVIC